MKTDSQIAGAPPAAPRRADGNGSVAVEERPVVRAPAEGRVVDAEKPEGPNVTTRSPKSRRLLWIVPILLIVGAVAVVVATRFWYESTLFVMTDNAQVTGDLIHVGSLNAGRLLQTNVEVGQTVQ